jgi:hypothetical protein
MGAAFAGATLLVGLAGCTADPGKVCEKTVRLAQPKLADDKRARAVAACVGSLERLRAKNEESYRCRAKCVMAVATLEDANGCSRLCGKVDEEGDIATTIDEANGGGASRASQSASGRPRASAATSNSSAPRPHH